MQVRVLSFFLLLASVTSTVASHAAAALTTTADEFTIIQDQRGLTLHKEAFALPFTHADRYHGRQSEIVFKLSAKQDLFGTRFYVAYSQISFWQAYDKGNSAPFRDTNYNPEIFHRFRESGLGPWQLGADAGFEHESNGQRMPLSRSWNLLYLTPSLRGDNWLLRLKLRYRIPEPAKSAPGAADGDDNPDITDYLGFSDFDAYYLLPKRHQAHLQVRGLIGSNKGNVSLNYSVPIPHSDTGFFVLRLFHGYGESLMDYRELVSRVGVGFMFSR